MLRDTGICTIYRLVDTAEPGGMPTQTLAPIFRGQYGQRSFGGSRRDPTGQRPDTRIDEKIRIQETRYIHAQDVVILADTENTGVLTPAYAIVDYYHDLDEDNGDPITDLYLQRYEKAVTLA